MLSCPQSFYCISVVQWLSKEELTVVGCVWDPHSQRQKLSNTSFTNSKEGPRNKKWHYISDDFHFYSIFLSSETELGSTDWNEMLIFLELKKRSNCLQLVFSCGFIIILLFLFFHLAQGLLLETSSRNYRKDLLLPPCYLYVWELPLAEMLIVWHSSFLFCFPGSQVYQ